MLGRFVQTDLGLADSEASADRRCKAAKRTGAIDSLNDHESGNVEPHAENTSTGSKERAAVQPAFGVLCHDKMAELITWEVTILGANLVFSSRISVMHGHARSKANT